MRSLFLRVHGGLIHLMNHQPETIGGQAVVEGVMMRSPERLSVAVRAPDGSIVLQSRPFVSFSKRHRILGLPVLRGGASLIEALYLGTQALNWSVKVQQSGSSAEEKDDQPTTARQKAFATLPLLISFVLALGLFQLLPYAAASFLTGHHGRSQNPLLFNGVAGVIRISLLLAYMWGLSFLPDLKRLFQYHGAEHKSIFAYENKAPLEIPDVARQIRFHPRCGTSFILIVALTCMLFFSLFDAFMLHVAHFAYPNFAVRFLIHLPFIPLVAGLAFELLRLSARYQDAGWVRVLILPGLWLQKITTQEPDNAQIEVALASVKASLA